VLTRGEAQDERVPAVLGDALGNGFAVGAAHLGDALEVQDAAAAEFSRACEGVL